ncbi:hypothetical protein SAMN00017477_1035 [Peptoniphilus asaccharolyticus DSM 20463]|uniref:Uncharacterized protein n=1 Tax=Peptoniphilus asaccharolyticus DSM 20463 TaxID=573058 RepID=A0A1W1V1D2_PEPAS|nr:MULTISPECIES: hypothetical protein [Peptoniphilus]MBL7575531.1 hypothetical protein [Peptoniphilus asaccharolyticus]MDY2987676.1 hypothetical protein [Peptoniphilus sp.]SMB87159.1 hypothetical protein SAMN00017477_1035 [Peptoniphilus asaccharolyticus DSM 20463]
MFKFDEKDFKKYLEASNFFKKYSPNKLLNAHDIELNKIFYEDYGYYAPIGDFRDLLKGIEVKIERFEPLKYYTPREYSFNEYCEYVERRFHYNKKTKMRDFSVRSAKECFEKYQRFIEGTPADSMDEHAELHRMQEKVKKEDFYNW